MYFDFEDHRPDTPLLDRPLTRLEQILLTIIAYLLIVISMIIYPRLPFVKAAQAARLEEEQREFKEFLDRLRHAKDKAEFDEFMAERRHRPQAPAPHPEN